MTEPNMTWLTSRDDAEGHTFPVGQVNDSTRTTLTALCEDSFPIDVLEDTLPSTFCRMCLVRLGELTPDENRWRTGG